MRNKNLCRVLVFVQECENHELVLATSVWEYENLVSVLTTFAWRYENGLSVLATFVWRYENGVSVLATFVWEYENRVHVLVISVYNIYEDASQLFHNPCSTKLFLKIHLFDKKLTNTCRENTFFSFEFGIIGVGSDESSNRASWTSTNTKKVRCLLITVAWIFV